MTDPKKKKFPGKRTRKKNLPERVPASFHANKKDQAAVGKISSKLGVSKADIIRYGIKLAIKAYRAAAKGEESITFDLKPLAKTI